MKRTIKKVITHPLFSGSAIMIGGSMTSNVINYCYHLIMGREMGRVNYGILSSLYAILYVISIVPQSTSLSIVKFISSAKDKREQTQIYYAVKALLFKVSLAGGILVIIISPLIANFLHINDIFSVALIGPILFFSLMTLVNQATAQGQLDFLTSVIPSFVVSVAKLALGFILVYLGYAVGGAMAGVAVAAVIAFVASRRVTRKMGLPNKSNKYDMQPMLKYATPVLFQAVAFTSLISMDVILVKHFFPADTAGYYAAISTLGKIIFFAAQPVTSAMFPVISKRVSMGEKYLKIFMMSSAVTLLIAVSATLAYWLLPNLAIGVSFGGGFTSATNDLVWMGVFFSLYSFSYLLVSFFLSINKTEVVLLPVVVAVLQVLLIWFKHDNVLTVIQISIVLMVMLCTCLGLYFANLLKKAKIAL